MTDARLLRVCCVFFLDPDLCRFESVHCAQKAKAALNGADIYAGCCTLKIEYARVSGDVLQLTYVRAYALLHAVVIKRGPYNQSGPVLQADSGQVFYPTGRHQPPSSPVFLKEWSAGYWRSTWRL